MQNIKIVDVKIEKVDFINNVVIADTSKPIDIQIENKVSSMVNYDDQNARCKCTINVDIIPQNVQVDFKVVLCVVGVLEFEMGAPHKEVHVAAFKKMFPHVQSRVATFMTLVGIPNYFLEEPNIESDQVEQAD